MTFYFKKDDDNETNKYINKHAKPNDIISNSI